MPEFKKKKKQGAWAVVWPHVIGVLIIILFVFLVVSDIKVYQKKRELNNKIEGLKDKIERIGEDNESLKQGISNADHDGYVEKVAREDLDLKKPGETVVSFITSKEEEDSKETPQNFFTGWIRWISEWFK